MHMGGIFCIVCACEHFNAIILFAEGRRACMAVLSDVSTEKI